MAWCGSNEIKVNLEIICGKTKKMMWCALLSLIFTYKKFHKAKIKNK